MIFVIVVNCIVHFDIRNKIERLIKKFDCILNDLLKNCFKMICWKQNSFLNLYVRINFNFFNKIFWDVDDVLKRTIENL